MRCAQSVKDRRGLPKVRLMAARTTKPAARNATRGLPRRWGRRMVGSFNPRFLCAFALLGLAALGSGCQERSRMLPREVMPMRHAEQDAVPRTEAQADARGQPAAGPDSNATELEGAVSVRQPATTTTGPTVTVDG